MNGTRTALSIAMILIGTLFAIPSFIPAHAAIPNGTVCVDATTSFTCPSTPTVFHGAVGSTFNVAVNIFNSGALNGFAISLHVDPTVLKPINAATNGSIVATLPGYVFTATPSNCVNNGANGPPSNVGCTSFDGDGTTTFAFLSVGGLSIAPTTGRLFVASYQVVGLTSNTTIGYVVTGTPTATGTATCTGTSITNTCVTITNGGTAGPTPENFAETALFTVSSATGPFSVTASPASLTIVQGGSASSSITVMSLNGFAGLVKLNASISPMTSNGPVVGLSRRNVTLTAGSSNSSLLQVSTTTVTPAAFYTISVNASSAMGSTLAPIELMVLRPGFSIAVNPQALGISLCGSVSSQITVTSLNGFAGSVGLQATPVSPSLRRSVIDIKPATLNLVAGASVSASMTISIPVNVTSGNYPFIVTGSSSEGPPNATSFTVDATPDFAIFPSLHAVDVPLGSSNSTTVTVAGCYGFKGTINLNTTPASSLVPSLSKNQISLNQSSPSESATLAISAPAGASLANYTLTINGSNGTITHPITITVRVGDVGLSSSYSGSFRIAQGASYSLAVNVTSINGFNGNVTMSTAVSGGGLKASCSPGTLAVHSRASAQCILTVSVPAGAAPGKYNVTVTVTQGSVTHSLVVPVTVVAPPHTATLPPVEIFGIITAAIVASLAITAVVVSRRRRRNSV